MQKNNDPESGFFGPRIFLALVLCLTGVSLSLLSLRAASPAPTAPVSTSAANASSASTSAPETTLNIATTPGMPRYYTYAPPPGMGETAGEPSIGFNPVSGKVMYISTLQTLQATLPERITPLASA